MNIQEIRQKYPQYNDMTDTQLADGFHKKYYGDIPKEDFYTKIGISTKKTENTGIASIIPFSGIEGAPSGDMGEYSEASQAVASTAEQFATMPAKGLYGLSQMLGSDVEGAPSGYTGGTVEQAADVMERSGVIPMPKTRGADELSKVVNYPFEKIKKYAGELPGEAVLAVTNSPAWATVVATIGEVGAYAILGRIGKGRKAKPKEVVKEFEAEAHKALSDLGPEIPKDAAKQTVLDSEALPKPGLPAPPSEGKLFPGQKEGLRLVAEEPPTESPRGEFTPVPEEQPLLTGTEKAYRDVGMAEKSPIVLYRDSVVEQIVMDKYPEHIAAVSEALRGMENPPAVFFDTEMPKARGMYDPAQDTIHINPKTTSKSTDLVSAYKKTIEHELIHRKQKDRGDITVETRRLRRDNWLEREARGEQTETASIADQIQSLRSILPDFEHGKRLWSEDAREVIGSTSNMYPPWFKDYFPNDTPSRVLQTIDKIQKNKPLGKRDARIADTVRNLAKDAVERGEDIGESYWKEQFAGQRGQLNVGDIVRTWGEFWTPLSTVPQGRQYMALRYGDMLGGLAKVDRVTRMIHDRFKDISYDHRRDLFNAIRGEMPIDQLPQELQLLAKQTRADISRVGEMAVRKGLLKRDTFQANKDTYIHYQYLRHLFPEDAPKIVGKGGRLDLTYLKQRKDLTESQRQALGLVDDVQFAAPMGIGKVLGDIVKKDFYEQIAANPEWVWQPSREIAKLVKEHKAYKEMVESGRPVSPELRARYQALDAQLKDAMNQAGKAPVDFVQMPDSPGYGELRGAYVRREIANDLLPIGSINPGEVAGLARAWDKLGKGIDVGMSAFKVGKVAVNVPTAVRNMVSNLVQMNMSGIPLYKMPSVLIDGVKSYRAKDRFYRELENRGGFKTNFSVAELGEVLRELEKVKGGKFESIVQAVQKLSSYYGKIDDLAKMALYRDARMNGVPPIDAAMHAQKWGMDYSLASRSVKHARRYVLPFASYQYKIAPLIAETLTKRPWVIAKYAAIPYLMKEWAARTFDWTDKDLEKAEKMMEERTKHEGQYVLLPVKDNRGNVEILNMEYFMPWGNWMETIRSVGKAEFTDALKKQFGTPLGPYGTLGAGFVTKLRGEPPKDPFSGMPIYSALDDPSTQYMKQAEWYWQTFGPSSISSRGALGYTVDAIRGDKNRWGVEATPAKAALKWLGANVGSLTPQQITANRKYQLKQLENEAKKILRDPKSSPEDKKTAIRNLNKLRREIINPQ